MFIQLPTTLEPPTDDHQPIRISKPIADNTELQPAQDKNEQQPDDVTSRDVSDDQQNVESGNNGAPVQKGESLAEVKRRRIKNTSNETEGAKSGKLSDQEKKNLYGIRRPKRKMCTIL